VSASLWSAACMSGTALSHPNTCMHSVSLTSQASRSPVAAGLLQGVAVLAGRAGLAGLGSLVELLVGGCRQVGGRPRGRGSALGHHTTILYLLGSAAGHPSTSARHMHTARRNSLSMQAMFRRATSHCWDMA